MENYRAWVDEWLKTKKFSLVKILSQKNFNFCCFFFLLLQNSNFVMRHSLLLGCSLCVGMRGVAGIERIAWCGGGVAAWLFASRCGADGRLTVACGESRATAAQPSLYQEHGWHLITIQKRVALRWWPSVVLTPIHEVSVHLSLCDSLLLIIRCFWYLSCIYSNIHIIP